MFCRSRNGSHRSNLEKDSQGPLGNRRRTLLDRSGEKPSARFSTTVGSSYVASMGTSSEYLVRQKPSEHLFVLASATPLLVARRSFVGAPANTADFQSGIAWPLSFPTISTHGQTGRASRVPDPAL